MKIETGYLFREILGENSVILLQNAFPTLEKYIDHVHLLPNGKPARVIKPIQNEILDKFEYILKLKEKESIFSLLISIK